MEILLVEDELSKEKNIITFLNELTPVSKVVVKHSITSTKIELRNKSYEYILLDMSLPLFDNDDISYMEDNEFEAFGGIAVLDEIDRLNLPCKVIVITAFDILGEGNDRIDLPQIRKNLAADYPEQFVGAVYYNSSSLEWKTDLARFLNVAYMEEHT